jgi:hypothetical protein
MGKDELREEAMCELSSAAAMCKALEASMDSDSFELEKFDIATISGTVADIIKRSMRKL